MRKILRRMVACCLLAAFCWSYFIIRDRKKLQEGLIRFHVVAHSDSIEDQAVKIKIRDTVLAYIQEDIERIGNIQEARAYLQENLPKLQQLVNLTLKNLGFSGDSKISLCKEPFEVRHYDTFSLPAGVYESLRIVIGDGLGKNWWCVSFPSFCIPATTSGFEDTAVSAGFSDPLVQALSANRGYEVHFYFLDQLGKLENIFFHQ